MKKTGLLLIVLLIAITLYGCTSNQDSKGHMSKSITENDKDKTVGKDKELNNEQVKDMEEQNIEEQETVEVQTEENQTEEDQNIEEQQENKEESVDNKNPELKEIDTNQYFILEDQSFDITLEPWGDVTFTSCIPLATEGVDPLTDASFYLLKDKKIVYEFPPVASNNIREVGGILGVTFVMFKDINGDSNKDVIIGSNYITGAGPQGMIPYTEVRIYIHTGTEFTYDKELSEKINNQFDEEITAEDVKKFLDMIK